MASRSIVPVILSGGSGTRLWPLSNDRRPKQFHSLVSPDASLFQQAVQRTAGIAGKLGAPLVICNESHRFMVAEQLRQIDVTPGAIVLEPSGRNTAPAVAASALIALRGSEPDEDPFLLVLAADHVIRDVGEFHAAVAAAADAADQGYLVTFGIVPDKPITGYGYLHRGESHGGWSVLDAFVEKPDLPTATDYVSSGEWLWNSGMFLFSAKTYLGELSKYRPQILSHVEAAVDRATTDQDFTRLSAAFADCPSESIDYAVMENTPRAAVVPLDAGWSDVGSWPALYDVLDKDDDGNVLQGSTLTYECRNCLVASTSRPVGVVGLDGIIVVETEDAVLVMSQDKGQELKKILE